jgi:hypothetical protein
MFLSSKLRPGYEPSTRPNNNHSCAIVACVSVGVPTWSLLSKPIGTLAAASICVHVLHFPNSYRILIKFITEMWTIKVVEEFFFYLESVYYKFDFIGADRSGRT